MARPDTNDSPVLVLNRLRAQAACAGPDWTIEPGKEVVCKVSYPDPDTAKTVTAVKVINDGEQLRALATNKDVTVWHAFSRRDGTRPN